MNRWNSELGVVDDFRTFDWDRYIPFPEITMDQVKGLLALV